MYKLLRAVLLFLYVITSAKMVSAQTILLQQGFDNGSLPAGWSQDSAGTTPYFQWMFSNLSGRCFYGNSDTAFTLFDSDYFGNPNSQHCALVSPAFDATTFPHVYIVIDEVFHSFANSSHQIQVSNNNGVSWTSLLSDSTSDVGGIAASSQTEPDTVKRNTYDISSIASGHSSVRVRFMYAGNWGWFWMINNFKVIDNNNMCSSPPISGSVMADHNFYCGTTPVQLSLSGNSAGTGQSYQWQSSVNGSSWSDLLNETGTSVQVMPSTNLYYRCVSTCTSVSTYTDGMLISTSPDPGATSSSLPFICDNVHNIDLVCSNVLDPAGQTYQWESSADGNFWTTISGQTDSIATVNPSSAMYYRCTLACGLNTSSSQPVYVGRYFPVGGGCYCGALNDNPCDPFAGDFISHVSISGTTLNSTSSCTNGLINNYSFTPPFGNGTANLQRGSMYTVSVTTTGDHIISMWIDYNHDGSYDPSEWTQVATSSNSGIANTANFTVPSGALTGETGMRIRSRGIGSGNGSADACTDFYSGETEDFVIGIETMVSNHDLNSSLGMNLYPNPGNGLIRLSISANDLNAIDVRVYSVLGIEICTVHPAQQISVLDLSGSTDGVYFVRISDGINSQVQKLVIRR